MSPRPYSSSTGLLRCLSGQCRIEQSSYGNAHTGARSVKFAYMYCFRILHVYLVAKLRLYCFVFSFVVTHFGRPFVKRFALCYQTVVCLSVCDVRALWLNGWMDQDVTWYGAMPRPRRLCVRWGPRFPSPKGGWSPQIFLPMFIVVKRLDG